MHFCDEELVGGVPVLHIAQHFLPARRNPAPGQHIAAPAGMLCLGELPERLLLVHTGEIIEKVREDPARAGIRERIFVEDIPVGREDPPIRLVGPAGPRREQAVGDGQAADGGGFLGVQPALKTALDGAGLPLVVHGRLVAGISEMKKRSLLRDQTAGGFVPLVDIRDQTEGDERIVVVPAASEGQLVDNELGSQKADGRLTAVEGNGRKEFQNQRAAALNLPAYRPCPKKERKLEILAIGFRGDGEVERLAGERLRGQPVLQLGGV